MTSKLLQHLLAGRISSGYPPDEIRFVANERRAPFLANVRLAFPRCSVHLIDWKRRSTLIGHKSDLIRWISAGFMIFRPCYLSFILDLLVHRVSVLRSPQTGSFGNSPSIRGWINHTKKKLKWPENALKNSPIHGRISAGYPTQITGRYQVDSGYPADI